MIRILLAVIVGAWGAQALRPEAAFALPGPPWNWLAACGPGIAALLAGWLRPQAGWVRSLGSGRLAIAALLAVAATCWPIAVYPVGVDAPAWLRRLGLGDPLSSLPFAAALVAVTLNLAASLGRRLREGPDRLRFAVLHAGLLIAIVGGAAGHGGLVKARFSMAEGGRPGDLVRAVDGREVRLPAALALDDFAIERFPPMLLLSDGAQVRRGEALLGPGVRERLGGLDIAVRTWLPSAAVPADSPVGFNDPSANPAAEVSVRDAAGRELGSGWLHPAGPMGHALFIALPDGRTLHLDAPRPKRFLARVRVDGQAHEIVVNRPLRLAGWAIYLLGYDEALGPASRTASFEAVEDRALPAVYLGIALLLAGVLWHLWRPVAAGGRP